MTEFEIKQLEQDARRLIVCTGCYGSGEDRWNEGRACPTCSGAGKSAAEPRVIELIQRVRQLEAAVQKFVSQYPWQSSPEILELAALVEEP